MDKRLSNYIDKELYGAAKGFREDFKKYLESEVDSLLSNLYSQQDYQSPSWGELKADQLGSLRTLRKVIDIL